MAIPTTPGSDSRGRFHARLRCLDAEQKCEIANFTLEELQKEVRDTHSSPPVPLVWNELTREAIVTASAADVINGTLPRLLPGGGIEEAVGEAGGQPQGHPRRDRPQDRRYARPLTFLPHSLTYSFLPLNHPCEPLSFSR